MTRIYLFIILFIFFFQCNSVIFAEDDTNSENISKATQVISILSKIATSKTTSSVTSKITKQDSEGNALDRTYYSGDKAIAIREYGAITKMTGKVPDGTIKAYYENGNVMLEEVYKNNMLNGTSKEYYENGQVMAEYTYDNDKSIGTGKYYHENGTIRAEFPYNDEGNIDGIVKKYNDDGTLTGQVEYKNGERVGDVAPGATVVRLKYSLTKEMKAKMNSGVLRMNKVTSTNWNKNRPKPLTYPSKMLVNSGVGPDKLVFVTSLGKIIDNLSWADSDIMGILFENEPMYGIYEYTLVFYFSKECEYPSQCEYVMGSYIGNVDGVDLNTDTAYKIPAIVTSKSLLSCRWKIDWKNMLIYTY